MSKPKLLAYRIRIMGKPWTVYFASKAHYKKKCGKDSVGMTMLLDKEIYILASRATFEVIAHELMHAFIEETGTTPAGLDAEQIEELCCDLMGKRAREIVGLTEEIMTAHRILKNKVEEPVE